MSYLSVYKISIAKHEVRTAVCGTAVFSSDPRIIDVHDEWDFPIS
jgi:hypothetical protein